MLEKKKFEVLGVARVIQQEDEGYKAQTSRELNDDYSKYILFLALHIVTLAEKIEPPVEEVFEMIKGLTDEVELK